MNAAYCSLGVLLEEVRSLFPSALIGDSGWERLYPLTRQLPLCVADHRFGFEFNLCDPDPTADFFVIASPDTRLADFYRRLDPCVEPALIGNGFAAFLAEHCRAGPDSFLVRANKGIMLEYDLATAPPGEHSVPGIFISTRGQLERDIANLQEDTDALVETLRSAAGWEPDAGETRQVRQSCAALAALGIGIGHAGVMPGRAERKVRLVARSVESVLVPGALEQVKWPGDPSRPAAILAAFSGVVYPRVWIDIDVSSSGVLPSVGLEFTRMLQGTRLEESFRLDPAGWKLLIDRLEEKGWCLPAKAEGLRNWSRLEVFFGRDGMYQIRQTINHVKVVIDPEMVFAKAYVGVDVRRITQ